MRITDVIIKNWKAPGKEWCDAVAAKPDEHLIKATIEMILTHREYQEMLAKSVSEELKQRDKTDAT
jgi:hypothetical protein